MPPPSPYVTTTASPLLCAPPFLLLLLVFLCHLSPPSLHLLSCPPSLLPFLPLPLPSSLWLPSLRCCYHRHLCQLTLGICHVPGQSRPYLRGPASCSQLQEVCDSARTQTPLFNPKPVYVPCPSPSHRGGQGALERLKNHSGHVPSQWNSFQEPQGPRGTGWILRCVAVRPSVCKRPPFPLVSLPLHVPEVLSGVTCGPHQALCAILAGYLC